MPSQQLSLMVEEEHGESILMAKLRQETPPILIDRPHLSDRLLAGGRAQLTLISAPAGYGKSSLLAVLGRRLVQAGEAVGWLSLDPDDNDPLRLLTYLAAAVEGAVPGVGRHATGILRSGQQPMEILAVRSLLANVARVGTAITLFIDDAHLLTAPAVQGVLPRLIQGAPPNLRFMVASRTELPLDLSHLRLSGGLREVDAAALALRLEEIQLLAARNGLAPLDPAVLRALHESTEGWAAGIQLFLLARAHGGDPEALLQGFDGRDRHLSDYLGQTVLRALRPALRNFLLQTAALDRFCAASCEALLPQTGCKAMIEELDRANLFVIPLDRRREWYRYHHLFGDFLRDRLETEQPGQLAANFRRAARWCAEYGAIGEAISYAKRGRDYDFAADLIAGASEQTGQYQGDHGSLLHWIVDLPDSCLDRLPQIRLGRAWSLSFNNGHAEALAEINRVEDLAGLAPPEQSAALRQSAGMIRCVSACLSGDADTARLGGAAWLDTWPDAPDFDRGAVANAMAYACIARREHAFGLSVVEVALTAHRRCGAAYGVVCALAVKGLLLTAMGRLTEAEEVIRTGMEDARQLWGEHSQAASQMAALLGEVLYESDRIEEARRYLQEGSLAMEQIASPELKFIQYAIGARLTRLEDPDRALTLLQTGLVEARTQQRPLLAARLAAEAVALLLAEGRGTLAETVAWRDFPDAGVPGDGAEEPPWAAAQRIQAQRDAAIRHALWRGDSRAALADARRQVADLRQDGGPAARITAGLQNAAALQGIGAERAALRAVDEAVQLAAATGLIRRIVDGCAFARPVLKRYVQVRRSAAPTDIAAAPAAIVLRLEALCGLQPSPGAAPDSSSAGADFDLRPKERQILILVSQGLSNRDIAETLFVSEKTVKWHLYNTFSKLAVKNRTAAVRKAMEAGLLN